MGNTFKIEFSSDIRRFVQAVRDIVFPQYCLACGTGHTKNQEISFCITCLQKVRLLLEPFCLTCGKPFDRAAGKSHLCGYCRKNRWYFRQARSAVRYQPPVTEVVRIFKYRGKMYGLATFAALTQQYFAHQPLSQPDIIIPVPLHQKRLRHRGFNQALILSRKIFPEWQQRIDPHALERQGWTQPQTGLNRAARRRNVRNAFSVPRPETIKNKKILLVDDVFTTGATVNECARVLHRNQVAAVDVFTFARAIT